MRGRPVTTQQGQQGQQGRWGRFGRRGVLITAGASAVVASLVAGTAPARAAALPSASITTLTIHSVTNPSGVTVAATDGLVFGLGQVVDTFFTCDFDPGDPLVSCSDSTGHTDAPALAALATASPGHGVYTVTARTQAGATATASIGYDVAAPPTVGPISVPSPTALATLPVTATMAASAATVLTGVTAWIDTVSGPGVAMAGASGSAPVQATAVLGIDALADGAHQVIVQASDALGQVGTASTTFVVDRTAPVLTLPAPITVRADKTDGAKVGFTVSAQDAVSGTLVPSCDHTSGSEFPLGVTVVRCTATDQAGNRAQGGFVVNVLAPSGPPSVSVAQVATVTRDATLPITAAAAASDGAVISSITAWLDVVSGPGTALTGPFPGATVSAGGVLDLRRALEGTHTVIVVATDDNGQASAPATATVLVDRTAPGVGISIQPRVVVRRRPITVTPLARDGGSGVASAFCSPAPTDTLGHFSVICTAIDGAGNRTSVRAFYDVVSRPLDGPADLEVRAFGPSIATAGSVHAYHGRITNLGPGRALNTKVVVTFDPGIFLFVSADNGQLVAPGRIEFALTDLDAQQRLSPVFSLKALHHGVGAIDVIAFSAATDPVDSNDHARTTTAIL